MLNRNYNHRHVRRVAHCILGDPAKLFHFQCFNNVVLSWKALDKVAINVCIIFNVFLFYTSFLLSLFDMPCISITPLCFHCLFLKYKQYWPNSSKGLGLK